MNINLNAPNRILQVKNFLRPIDLLKWFEKANLQKYCYAYYVIDPNTQKEFIMNIGMSIGEEIGDRIYRKTGNLPGWGHLALTGERGADMKKIVKSFEEKYPHIKVHKDDVNIHIWETGHLQSNNLIDATVTAEKDLLTQCENRDGVIPPGNYQDPRTRNIVAVNRIVAETLFEGMC